MTHQEVQSDTIERFVRHQLSSDERRAFEEHYFECEECFEQVQMMARFVAGVCQAARKGFLTESAQEPWWAKLFRPAVIVAMSAAILLTIGVGWLLWRQPPTQQRELAVNPTPSLAPQPATSAGTTATPATDPPSKPDLLAQNRPTPPEAIPGKAPVVFLDSERGNSEANQLDIPANANNAILRIDVDPGNSFSGFQFQIFDPSGKLAVSANTGKATAKGVVSASVSTKLLQSGKYVVKCYGFRNDQRELVGEYKLQIQKP
ncbi:MAG: zf-HC2 domain-containing protein [Acidobacteria bacterium]|nr:zf-HC2 domain-containing protein [Acidobacteriota bacterium]